MTKNRRVLWDTVVAGNRENGDLSAANLTSDKIHVDGRPFSIQLVWTGAGSPVGTLSFETTNDDATWDAVDSSLFAPAFTNPGDGAGGADHTTVHFPTTVIIVTAVRVKYARTSGGTADTISGRVEVG